MLLTFFDIIFCGSFATVIYVGIQLQGVEINGGEIVDPSEPYFDTMVKVLIEKDDATLGMCSTSVIGGNLIFCARHCIYNTKTQQKHKKFVVHGHADWIGYKSSVEGDVGILKRYGLFSKFLKLSKSDSWEHLDYVTLVGFGGKNGGAVLQKTDSGDVLQVAVISVTDGKSKDYDVSTFRHCEWLERTTETKCV